MPERRPNNRIMYKYNRIVFPVQSNDDTVPEYKFYLRLVSNVK